MRQRAAVPSRGPRRSPRRGSAEARKRGRENQEGEGQHWCGVPAAQPGEEGRRREQRWRGTARVRRRGGVGRKQLVQCRGGGDRRDAAPRRR
eukprot:640438-Rhodomonas_salina.1